jgi:hypothetical protein
MDEGHKRAYRLLLYQAMLVIRPLAWRTVEEAASANAAHEPPADVTAVYREGRYCGEVADWLHNLAWFAAHDFEGFDTGWFWDDLERLERAFPEFNPGWFRSRFQAWLAESAGEKGG